jgi:hypothetical protein
VRGRSGCSQAGATRSARPEQAAIPVIGTMTRLPTALRRARRVNETISNSTQEGLEQHMRLIIRAIAILASASVGTACWAKEQSFSKRSSRVRVGCEDTRGTQIEYHAPPGWRIIRYDTGWVGLSGVGGHTAKVQANPSERPTSVFATGTIRGRNRVSGVRILGRRMATCPGSGRGWLQVAGIIAR